MGTPDSIVIKQMNELNMDEIAPFVQSSLEEGYNHIARLKTEYADGKNRFNQPGEALIGAYDGKRLIGICGLNWDPFLGVEEVGRVRRLYVMPAYRRRGAGKLLMRHIVQEAEKSFHTLVLKTDTSAADQFYRSLGFSYKEGQDSYTHQMMLKQYS